MADAQQNLPRVLVTGFSVFPGAPLNPTEHLIPLIQAERSELASICGLTTEVYPVDFQGLPARLEATCRDGSPDIAIHFGLSASATGITLERVARNAMGVGRPDNAGFAPTAARIHADLGDLPSTLPFERLHRELEAAGLPVAFSDDAGDYLCNYIFYLSRSKLCPGFEPAMSGFVHVPPLREGRDGDVEHAMRLDQLLAAALIIIRISCEEFASRNAKSPA